MCCFEVILTFFCTLTLSWLASPSNFENFGTKILPADKNLVTHRLYFRPTAKILPMVAILKAYGPYGSNFFHDRGWSHFLANRGG